MMCAALAAKSVGWRGPYLMFNPQDCAITLLVQAAGNVPGRRVGVRTNAAV